jgi:hypothetical protein
MSKHNKVNPDHYHQAGRMTPDEAARERGKIQQVSPREDRADVVPAAPERDSTPKNGEQHEAGRGGPITATARRKAAARR